MVNFTIDEVRNMMKRPNYIRNICVIAHVDHGKTTLTDSLISKAGIISEDSAGEKRYTQTKLEEQLRGITIKSAAVSLYYEKESDEGKNESYLVNLIDSPGHIDFSSEVTAALRVTDGALVVVDCIEGPRVQTETVLRQAIAERIKPILFLNKLDRIFLELNQPLEDCYKNFRSTIESVNVVINTYYDPALGNIDVLPEIGTVGFGSGLMAWGFTLKNFAKFYSSKFGLSIEKLMKKLWGENYWDPKNQQWVKTNNNGTLERSFNQFVLGPVKLLCESIMKEQKEVYIPIIQGLQLKITKHDFEKCETPKDLLKMVMRKWLPAGDTLLDMITNYLPSPITAQKYRVENLYSGPLDTLEAQAIRFCDANGPMSMYITKMFPSSDKKRFIAFGRVFSGVVKSGQEVRICGPDYEHGKKNDLYIKKIQRCLLMMGRYDEQIPECPAGNVCGVLGVSEYLLKSGTLTTSENMYPFHTMKFSVAAVVQVAVEPKNPKDLPKLLEGLKALSHSDQIIKVYTDKLGQHIVAGSGTLHLNTCLKDLKDDFMNGIDINVSQPTVSFAETITSKTGEGSSSQYPKQVVSKAPNKLNRLYVSAEPLDKALLEAIDNGTINTPQDLNAKLCNVKNNNETELNKISQKQEELDILQDNKKLSKEYINELVKDYNFDIRKLWTFGCVPDAKTNILVDMTKGLQHMDEIKQHIISAFMTTTNGGVLCDEIMRGTRFNIEDALIHSDPMHRGVGQIMPCARKAFYAAQIASNPKLLEPIYLVEITTPIKFQSGVFLTINSKRGSVIKIEERINTPLISIQSFLPVIESFNFNELLRKNTGGQAFEQMKFSHWDEVLGNPFTQGTLSYNYILDIRKRKGLKLELPIFNDYYDKV